MANEKCAAQLLDGRWRCGPCDQSWDENEILVCWANLKPWPATPAEILDAGAKTFRERNTTYGSNYKRQGAVLLALFGGTIPTIETEEQANRLHLFVACVTKLSRYATNFKKGGHKDSAHDLMIYAAMLEEFSE